MCYKMFVPKDHSGHSMVAAPILEVCRNLIREFGKVFIEQVVKKKRRVVSKKKSCFKKELYHKKRAQISN